MSLQKRKTELFREIEETGVVSSREIMEELQKIEEHNFDKFENDMTIAISTQNKEEVRNLLFS